MPYAHNIHGQARRSATVRRAFTATELILGLLITSLIGVALATFTGAVGDAWSAESQTTVAHASDTRGQAYTDRIVREACDVGYWAPGTGAEPATLLLWATDDFAENGAKKNDRKPQKHELVLIRHDRAAQTIKLYRPRAWSLLTLTQQLLAVVGLSNAQLGEKATADGLAAAGWVEAHTLIGGNGAQVTSANFGLDRSGKRPVVKFSFVVDRDGTSGVLTGLIALRAKQKDDDWSEGSLLEEAVALPLDLVGGLGDTLDDTLDLFGGL